MAVDPPVQFLATGAIIQRFDVAGHNIVLGFPTLESYRHAPYFGETIGRVTNRIKGGVIDQLNGRSYTLATNNPPNHSHGGVEGWGKKVFDGPLPEVRKGKYCVRFTYVSPHDEEGYPGSVEIRIWYYTATEQTARGEEIVLEAEYEVELTGDDCEETAVSVTNHSYFNIGGRSTIAGTQCVLSTSHYLPLDDNQIPLGTIEEYTGINPASPFVLHETTPVFDNCFVMTSDIATIPLDTRGLDLRLLASFYHPETRLNLQVSSTEPGFQFYTGEYIDVKPSAHDQYAYGPRSGFCIEPCRFTNAINVPEWRQQCLLKRGQVWGSEIVYRAWKA